MDALIANLHQHAMLYAVLAGVVIAVTLARRVRILGTIVSMALLMVALVALVNVVEQRAAFDPAFARIAKALRLGQGDPGQQVVGKEVRIPMARDGHFWVRATIGGVQRRMLVDSGATVTALSADTAQAAGLQPSDPLFPMTIRTANGAVAAQTATVDEFRIGNTVARDLPVVVSPAFGDMNVVGMNFLSRLKSWRVEDGTLILEPHHPQATAGGS